MPTRCIIVISLSQPGWNKRSGSTKQERALFKVRSVIDVDPDSPRGDLLLFIAYQVEPLRLFHPTVGGLRNISE